MVVKPPTTLLAGLLWTLAAWPVAAQPVSVDDLVARALQRVPALASARATARAQAARVGVARSGYLPQVGVGAGYARASNVPPAPFGSLPGDGGTANVTLRQELFNFGQTAAQVEAARAAAEVSSAQASASATQVAFNVRQAYMQWAEAQGLEARAREQVANARTLLGQAQSFYRNGVRPRIDVTRAEVVLAQAQAAQVDASNAVEIAHRSLETAIGGDAVTGEPVFPSDPALVLRPAGALEDLALREQPSLQVGNALLRSAQANRESAQRMHLPAISISALGGMRAQEMQLGPDWQAGINLTVPLYSGGSIASQVQATREAEQAAAEDLSDRSLQVRLGVERAYITMGGAREKLVAYQAALSSARENYQLAENRYRSAVGSIIEVSDAQALLAGAQADLVRGQAAYQLAIADLERAIGLTGLEPDVTKGPPTP